MWAGRDPPGPIAPAAYGLRQKVFVSCYCLPSVASLCPLSLNHLKYTTLEELCRNCMMPQRTGWLSPGWSCTWYRLAEMRLSDCFVTLMENMAGKHWTAKLRYCSRTNARRKVFKILFIRDCLLISGRPPSNACISGHVTKMAVTPFDPP